MSSEKSAENEEDIGSFIELLKDAMENTGMQGLPNVSRQGSWFRRLMWLLICFVGIVIMTWQITLAVMKFYTYPTATTIDYEQKTSLEFPAVTICNYNPISLNHLQTNPQAAELLELVQQRWAILDSGSGPNSTAPDTFSGGFDTGYQYSYDTQNDDSNYGDLSYSDVSYQGEDDPEFEFVDDFITMVTQMNVSQRALLGHELSDMIVSCKWQGKKCRIQQFNTFHNYLYGNCYTFNSGVPKPEVNVSGKTLKTNKIGPLYGFSLELYVEQEDYISGLTDGAGIVLHIHNQTQMPFPEDYGLSLSPGMKTSIGVTRRDIYRVSEPHGTCVDYTADENKERNAFLADISSIQYSVPACMKTCFQRELLKRCSCFDYKVPVNDKLKAYQNLGDDLNITDMLPCTDDSIISQKEACVKSVKEAYVTNTMGCSSMCHASCFDVHYPYRLSYAQWPSKVSEDRVLNVLSKKSQFFWDLVKEKSIDPLEKSQWLRENFIKLNVYYSDFDKEIIETFPSYDAIALVSDLGGQAGLWLGVSVVAFFELFQLIFDIICLKVNHMKNKGNKHNQVDNYDEIKKSKVEPI